MLLLLLTRSFHAVHPNYLERANSQTTNSRISAWRFSVTGLMPYNCHFSVPPGMILLQAASKLHFETQMENCAHLVQVARLSVPGRCLCPAPLWTTLPHETPQCMLPPPHAAGHSCHRSSHFTILISLVSPPSTWICQVFVNGKTGELARTAGLQFRGIS